MFEGQSEPTLLGGMVCTFFFLCITLKPRVKLYTRSMSLEYEPSSEPLHMAVMHLNP